MNLHGIASGYVAAVSPPTAGTLFVSTGYTTDDDGTQQPTYAAFEGVSFDVQAASGEHLRQLSALNIQGIMRAVYLNGNVEGLDRLAGKGGDILQWGSPAESWLVVHVPEPWDANGWTLVIVQLQTKGPSIGSADLDFSNPDNSGLINAL